VSVALLSRAAA
jgi:hypothetical protein